MDCQCGCGESVPNGSFKPRHDQRLRTDLERRVGGIFGFRDLVEAAEKYNAGQSDNGELAKGVAAIFKKFGHG
jgi:hypothetical protein